MKQKTAMMELIDKLRSNMGELGFIDWIKDNREQLLEKEKEQIMDAYNCGIEEEFSSPENGEQYYNQTYLEEVENEAK